MSPDIPWPPEVDPTAFRLDASGLVLTPLREEDAPELLDLARESAPEISRWMRWTNTARDLPGAQAVLQEWIGQWNRGEGYSFAARETPSGRIMGGGGLNQFNVKNRFGNLAYWVRTSARGRGLAPRIARSLAQFGFSHLGLVRVEILMEPANVASVRAAEKSGALREGLLRHRILNGTEPRPAVLYSLIPTDLTAASSHPR